MSTDLAGVLLDGQRLGFLGPGPVMAHLAHAGAFLVGLGGRPEGRLLDLGSGGGVPGLALALALPGSQWVLLDAGQRRTDFLREAVVRLGLAGRVEVVHGRAELVGRGPLRAGCAAVVARSFGAPAVVAECAAPLLTVGGVLVVSEPPLVDDGRWPSPGLRQLGLEAGGLHVGPPAMMVLTQVAPCPETYPRRSGVPSKRPLW